VTSIARTAASAVGSSNRRRRGRGEGMSRGSGGASEQPLARWSGDAPDDGARSHSGSVGSRPVRCGTGQLPVPAAATIAARRPSLN
jgi:hypothetical protein